MGPLAAALVAALALVVPRYDNPVSESFADTFADPVIVDGGDGTYYAYGTTDPLREGERTMHRIPMARSTDLVHWKYVGDAFTGLPSYARPSASLWAPDVRRDGNRWLMYVTVTETNPDGGSAIGVATAPRPTGPWTFTSEPAVPARQAPDGGWWWTFDPAQLTTPEGKKYLYYGSYFGGIWVSELSRDGLRVTGTATRVAIDNKFEGAYVVRRNGWYYLFASSANCCAGPTTGYSVSVGRSRSPLGPFTDRDGLRLDVSRAGGTPVIAPNGNRWVGTGHNGLITDRRGQDWFVYHAIDRDDPYLDEPFGINERPMLLDRLDWAGGWPTVNHGNWASDGPVRPLPTPRAGRLLAADEFTGGGLGAGWSWVRQDPAATVGGGALRWPVTGTDLTGTSNNAGVLLRDAPAGNWIAETKLTLPLGEDTVRNYQQAGLIAYAGDDLFARLSAVAIWNTRQVEFGKEMPYADALSYGGTIAGTPGLETTWLRLAHRTVGGEHHYRAGVSRDGKHWTWGGVWTLPKDSTPRIGLVAHGGAEPAVTASFDYLRFFRW